jgi:adenylylsulfate kinase
VRYLSIIFEIKDLDRTNPVSDELQPDKAAATEEAGNESQIFKLSVSLTGTERVSVDRVHAVHDVGERWAIRRACGPLARHGQDRVRPPRPLNGYYSTERTMTNPQKGLSSVHENTQGFTLWFTGLSGSGKTTIARIIGPEIERRGVLVDHLDGDVVRTHLSKGLGFSREDRDANILRIGFVSKLLTRHGAGVIVAAISPYAETRDMVRDMVGSVGNFVEVFVSTSLEECARRDVKGLYAKAFSGEIKEFTGVSDPYEAPVQAEVVVETEGRTPEESAAFVISELERLNVIPPVLEEAVA